MNRWREINERGLVEWPSVRVLNLPGVSATLNETVLCATALPRLGQQTAPFSQPSACHLVTRDMPML